VSTGHAGHRLNCPRCDRPISIAFGGRRITPHNTAPSGGERCLGSRLLVGDAIAEHTARHHDGAATS
jgi:hypothetical protein